MQQQEGIEGLTPEQQEKLNAFLGEGGYDKHFTAQEVLSAIKMLVDPGEKPEQLHMRADFYDDAQATAATEIEAHCTLFHDKVHLAELHNTMAARTAIKAKRINKLVEAVIGQQRQPQTGGGGDWLKRKAGVAT
jgi:hypothetical protein